MLTIEHPESKVDVLEAKEERAVSCLCLFLPKHLTRKAAQSRIQRVSIASCEFKVRVGFVFIFSILRLFGKKWLVWRTIYPFCGVSWSKLIQFFFSMGRRVESSNSITRGLVEMITVWLKALHSCSECQSAGVRSADGQILHTKGLEEMTDTFQLRVLSGLVVPPNNTASKKWALKCTCPITLTFLHESILSYFLKLI